MDITNIETAISSFKLAVAASLFLIYLAVDGLYAYYTLSVTLRKPFQAATSGFIMHFLLAFGVINYTHNFLYVIPLAMGSWLGRYLVVKYSNLVLKT